MKITQEQIDALSEKIHALLETATSDENATANIKAARAACQIASDAQSILMEIENQTHQQPV